MNRRGGSSTLLGAVLFVALPPACPQERGSSYYGPAIPGSPAITTVSTTASATTVEASFTTAYPASPSLACGTAAGSYRHTSVDAGIGTGIPHQQIVAGLAPSTTYHCQISATNAAGTQTKAFTQTTAAVPATSPITGLTVGTMNFYNAINSQNQGHGDTFYNCKSDDGTTYITSDDTTGFRLNGARTNPPASPPNTSYPSGPTTVMRFDNETPGAWVIETINYLNGYGIFSSGLPGETNKSEKDSGLFCMGGYLFMTTGHQYPGTQGAFLQNSGQVIESPDHGQSWNNFQNPSVFSAQGAPTSPIDSQMFPGTLTTMGTAAFVMYCGDDGTLGYTLPCNQHSNGDAFVYLVANEGAWNGGGSLGGGNVFYLARVPRAKMQHLNGADYQYFTGGDGSLDTSWSGAMASATPVISNTGKLGEPSVQYIPSLNRYLLLTFYYPQGTNKGNGSGQLQNSVWLGYEAPHPWGPWTLIHTSTWNGAYNPVVLNDTAWTGTTPTILWTGDFADWANYTLRYATVTINH